MREVFGGERKISLCRELTKLNEQTLRLTLDSAVALYENKEPRGEYVLVLEGIDEAGYTVSESEEPELSPVEAVEKLMGEGLSKMDAIKAVARERGVPKSEIYKLFC